MALKYVQNLNFDIESFFLACIGLSLYMTITQMLSLRIQLILSQKTIMTNNKHDGFLIKTPGCRIPYMDPFDYSIRDFIYKEERPSCNKNLPALIDSNSTSIFIVHSSITKYIHQKNTTFKCCYQTFTRREPKNNENDNQTEYSEDCTPFNQSARIYTEFIRVKCYDIRNKTFYQDFFSFVPLKSINKKTQKKKLNVLIIGMDGVSRLNFHRQMPKSYAYLKNLSAVELLGFNKVADNTFPNLMPVLTGLSEDELRKNCWKNITDRFDNCPFIWNKFKKNKFVTSFGEDASWMGIFNHDRGGFQKQPTDYMWGFFNRISEESIGNAVNKENAVAACVGAREVYQVFLNYIQNFVEKMQREKVNYFGFFWSVSLTHDDLNKASLGDDDYYDLFKKIKESGHLNNTVMIVMSDHGIRYGDIRQTFQGQIEERLPFLFVVLPEWYKLKYYEAYNNLKKNARRLTTPFDLHETFKDLLHPFALNSAYLSHRNTGKISRGYSLFTEISRERSCEDAGIASHWCTCQESKEVSLNDSNVVSGALFAVDFINRQLKNYTECAHLNLRNITSGRSMTHSCEHSDVLLNGRNIQDYLIIFETVPGNALFEVTVRSLEGDGILLMGNDKSEKMDVVGTISRVNFYGKQSACISDFHLKLYCYCRNLV